MDLIVNGTAAVRSSLGARRYYTGVMQHLRWEGAISITPVAPVSRLERVAELLRRGRRDAIFWSPCHRGPLFAHHHVITVLDCINVEYAHSGDWRLPVFRKLFQRILDNAQSIVPISYATRDALLRNYSVDASKIAVIAGPVAVGADLHARVQASPSLFPGHEKVSGERPFVLMVTNALPHKNTVMASRALAQSTAKRRGYMVRVVGSLAPEAGVVFHESGLHVEVHRGVGDAVLASWYARCAFLFSASLDEGLNLPVAEALACQANVLCTDIPVHREFYDGKVFFCEPRSSEAMTAAIDAALTRPGRWVQPGGSEPGRSFHDVADDYRALFNRIVDDRTWTR